MAISMTLGVKVNWPFDAISLAGLTRTLQEYENRWAEDKVVRPARKYPPKRNPRSTYKRTNRLKNRWRVQRSHFEGVDLVVRVLNDTPYRVKVMGDDQGRGQRPVHENWWPTVLEIAGASDFALGARTIIDRHIRGGRFSFGVTP